jgi:hypothetical protein
MGPRLLSHGITCFSHSLILYQPIGFRVHKGTNQSALPHPTATGHCTTSGNSIRNPYPAPSPAGMPSPLSRWRRKACQGTCCPSALFPPPSPPTPAWKSGFPKQAQEIVLRASDLQAVCIQLLHICARRPPPREPITPPYALARNQSQFRP